MTDDFERPILSPPPITRETLIAYAAASGDSNPVHVDPEAARRAGMPDVFAHGMLVMAYLGRVLTDRADLQQIESFSVRFAAITKLGDVLECRAEVAGSEQGELKVQLTAAAAGEVKLTGEARLRTAHDRA